jgi:nucleoside-diphosphate-sugar epimerase
MKVLIIGGSGLISTGITARLLASGHEVWWFNRGRSASALAGQVRLIQGDRTDTGHFEARMADAGPWDCVIDMICFIPEQAASAVRAFRGRTAHYVFCSTVDVYTKPAPRLPVVEACEQQPRSSFPYAFNKAACERVLWAAHNAGDLAVTAIRPAHTYGDGCHVLHTFGFDTWIVDPAWDGRDRARRRTLALVIQPSRRCRRSVRERRSAAGGGHGQGLSRHGRRVAHLGRLL